MTTFAAWLKANNSLCWLPPPLNYKQIVGQAFSKPVPQAKIMHIYMPNSGYVIGERITFGTNTKAKGYSTVTAGDPDGITVEFLA